MFQHELYGFQERGPPRWGQVGGNVCSIEHLLPIVVKVVRINQINFLFY